MCISSTLDSQRDGSVTGFRITLGTESFLPDKRVLTKYCFNSLKNMFLAINQIQNSTVKPKRRISAIRNNAIARAEARFRLINLWNKNKTKPATVTATQAERRPPTSIEKPSRRPLAISLNNVHQRIIKHHWTLINSPLSRLIDRHS